MNFSRIIPITPILFLALFIPTNFTHADVPITWDKALPTWDEALSGKVGDADEAWLVKKDHDVTTGGGLFDLGNIISSLSSSFVPSEDSIMRTLGQQLTRSFTHSVAEWIRTGQFNGGPLFISSLEDHLRESLDEVSGIFIEQLSPNAQNLLCSPFKLQVQLRISIKSDINFGRSSFQSRNACTASDILKNIDNLSDFDNVGWEGWLKLNEPQNNLFGTILLAEDEYNSRLANAQRSQENQYIAGQGSVGQRECLEYIQNPANPAKPFCSRYQTVVPGSTALGAINQQLGTDAESLIAADEANEIASALLDRVFKELGLTSTLFEDVSGGLLKVKVN